MDEESSNKENQQPESSTSEPPSSSIPTPAPVRPWKDPELQAIFQSEGIDLEGAIRIGTGHFSNVIKVQWKSRSCLVAMKVIQLSVVAQNYKKNFLPREIDLWKQLVHPNLVRLLGHYQIDDIVFLSMEYGPCGDMLRYIQRNGAVPENKASKWMAQILRGISHMHFLNIAHRDIKLENIIIFGEYSIKVADFGFSTWAVDRLSSTYCGSRSYVAPEILMGNPYDPFKADVWSLGVVAFVMVTDRMPFDESCSNEEIVARQRSRSYTFPSRPHLPSTCRRAIENMLTFSPVHRPSATGCFALCWPSCHRSIPG